VETTQLLLQLHVETKLPLHVNKDALHLLHHLNHQATYVIVTLMQLEFVEITQHQRQLLAETMLKQHVKRDALHLLQYQLHPTLTHVIVTL
jgi:hypothetical protein